MEITKRWVVRCLTDNKYTTSRSAINTEKIADAIKFNDEVTAKTYLFDVYYVDFDTVTQRIIEYSDEAILNLSETEQKNMKRKFIPSPNYQVEEVYEINLTKAGLRELKINQALS